MFQEKSEKKDIKGILLKYFRYWYLFVAGAILTGSIAYIYLRYATPMYSASGTLLFYDEKSGTGLSEAAAFNDIALMNNSRRLDNEVLLLRSHTLMQEVLQNLSLNISYWIEGQVRDVEIYGEAVPVNLIISKLDSTVNTSFVLHFNEDNTFDLQEGETSTSFKFGQEIKRPYGTFTIVSASSFSNTTTHAPLTVRFHNIKNLAHSYANRLSVGTVNQKASVLKIGITDAVPEKAVDIVNKLIEVYKKEAVNDKNRIAERTVEFLDERLKYLTEELNAVEMDVQEYKSENELTDVTSQAQQYLQSASANREQVEEIEIKLDVLRSIERYLKNDDRYQLVPSTLNIEDATLLGLITKFNELQLDRERMLRTSHPNNPIILNINDQLDNLRENIIENLENIKQALTITRRSLLARSGLVGSRIQRVPVMERELIEITRQQEIKRGLYLYLLQKREESALSLAATVSNTRVVDPPESSGPVSPNRTNVMAYSLLLGLFLPFAGLYVSDILSTKVRTRKDVQKLTDTPILGDVCHDESGDTVVAVENSHSPIAEMFRLMRTNLHISAGGRANKVLMITSSMTKEGKTFFSINMGSSLAGTGKKVLIIEFDLRKPKLIKRLDLREGKGLTEFLIGDVESIDDVIRPSGISDKLHIIGAGALPPNPAELILNANVGKMISLLKERYDYIILDTPPIGKVADAYTINEFADSSIYMVRYNYTEKEQIEIIDEIFTEQKLKNPLIVLNDSKKSNSDSYSYGY